MDEDRRRIGSVLACRRRRPVVAGWGGGGISRLIGRIFFFVVVVAVVFVIVVEAGFGFVFWESNRGEGGEMRKEKMVGPTKQFCFDQVTGMGPTNSVKNIEGWEVSNGAKRGGVF